MPDPAEQQAGGCDDKHHVLTLRRNFECDDEAGPYKTSKAKGDLFRHTGRDACLQMLREELLEEG